MSFHVAAMPERTALPGQPLPPVPDSAYPPDAVPLLLELDDTQELPLTWEGDQV